MPFFNEASRIYKSDEVTFLRNCFSGAVSYLEESESDYSAQELARSIIMLYERGLRDQSKLTESAAQLAHTKYKTRNAKKSVAAKKQIFRMRC